MRAFAKACGVSAGVVSQILAGKRIPSYKIAERLLSELDLTPEQQKHFLSSLALLHQKRGLKRLTPKFRELKAIQPSQELSIDLFRVIGDWYHYGILMLTCVEDFQSHPRWIASQLGISELEAKLAVERLLNVGLLIEQNGRLQCTHDHITTADKNITTPALKRRVKQSLEKAVQSVERDSIDLRSMTYMTMAIDPKRMLEAKKLIEQFTNQMSGLLESGPRLEVYEFGIYLYPLQTKRSSKEEIT